MYRAAWCLMSVLLVRNAAQMHPTMDDKNEARIHTTADLIMSNAFSKEGITPARTNLTHPFLNEKSPSNNLSDKSESRIQPTTANPKKVTSGVRMMQEATLHTTRPTNFTTKTSSNQQTTPTPIDPSSCAALTPNLDYLTQEQFVVQLTDACRYDKLIRPPSFGPLPVYMQMDLTHIESADQLQFKAHMLVQYLYRDTRLNFEEVSPRRGNLLGEELLRNRIWVPHIMIRNEKDTTIMGIDGKDVFISINPKGDVVYSYRLTATFYCWMNLQKFPFDSQQCNLKWNSWTYNSTNLVLHWDRDDPVKLATNLHLTEFLLSGFWTEEGDVEASFSKGAFVGNFSQVIFRFKLTREVGFYIMDYFLPSILLVVISWVSFWLRADASPPRVVLGTSTMLAFITLNGGLSKTLPKVSYIKASEIWFLACACFIFASMAEFAFVNVIWRRKKQVEMKKQSGKHILKGAISPNLVRKQLRKESNIGLYKARSCSSLESDSASKNSQANYLTVHSFPSNLRVPTITTQSQDELVQSEDSASVRMPDNSNPQEPQTWHTMTPQEVANWIDKKSRIVFPLSFLIFNIFYWSFVYLV